MIREALAALAAGLALTPAAARAEPAAPLVFVADPHMGMEGGVRTFDSLGRLAFHYETALPTLLQLDERRPPDHVAGALGRLAKLAFLDEPIAELEGTVIHEVYGHGGRARDLGSTATYTLRLPGVYCMLLSPTDESCTASTDSPNALADNERALLTTLGGIEANSLTAWWIDARMVAQKGAVHHGDLLVYEGTKLVYASSFLSHDLETPGKLTPAFNDVDHYVTLLQDRWNRVRGSDRATIASRLRTAYLWNLLDPMLVFSVYGSLVNLVNGDHILHAPLPTIGATTFYPSPRFTISPFGAENYVDLFVSRRAVVIDAYGRVVTSGLARASGGGLRMLGLPLTERVTVGAELDVWNQPEILFDVHAAYDRAQTWGMNTGVSADVRIIDDLGATARLAWKSKGWLTGQPIDEGLHGYVGMIWAWDGWPRGYW